MSGREIYSLAIWLGFTTEVIVGKATDLELSAFAVYCGFVVGLMLGSFLIGRRPWRR